MNIKPLPCKDCGDDKHIRIDGFYNESSGAYKIFCLLHPKIYFDGKSRNEVVEKWNEHNTAESLDK